jgi:RNA polymerase sigma-70 factor (ECF subfamily)
MAPNAMELVLGAQSLFRSKAPESSESALIDRCRRGDAEAFGRFVDLYQARVIGFVRRMVSNPEDAADIAQDTFLRAFQSFGRFDGRSSVRTWLFRIAHNLCIDRSRRLDRRVEESSLIDGEDESVLDISDERWQPDRILLDDELREAIDRGIASMSEKLRAVLLLHDREELAYDEIGAALDIPVGTVKSRLFLARAHLQASVKAYLEEK